jgi:hypothetical protein
LKKLWLPAASVITAVSLLLVPLHVLLVDCELLWMLLLFSGCAEGSVEAVPAGTLGRHQDGD